MRRHRSLRNQGINPKGFHPSQLGIYAVLLPLAAVMLLPIAFIVANAFKPPEELFLFPPRFWVARPSWRNFRELFGIMAGAGVPVSRYLFNSLLVSALTVLAAIVISGTAAYALSKQRFGLKQTLFAVNTVALMFVPVAVTIPRFLVIVRLGLFDSFWVHILPLLAMPVGVFLLKQFIDGVPDAVIESARIDGASEWRIYWQVVLPMIRPAVATIAILAFQAAWNNAETSALYVADERLRTFAFYVSTLAGTGGSASAVAAQGIAAAAALIMFLPNLVIFIALQSQVMSTMSRSGLK